MVAKVKPDPGRKKEQTWSLTMSTPLPAAWSVTKLPHNHRINAVTGISQKQSRLTQSDNWNFRDKFGEEIRTYQKRIAYLDNPLQVQRRRGESNGGNWTVA